MTQERHTNGTVTTAGHRRDRFAGGAPVRLDLSDGDWVLIRRELSYGQQRRLTFAGLTGVPSALAEQGQGQRLSMDMATYHVERLATWVVDWSFVDGDGRPVLVSREAIEALHPDTAAEVDAALDAYLEAQEAKKGPPARPPAPDGGPTGGGASAATSSSARRSAGATRP